MKAVGKYQVIEEIGRSATGTTFRARDPLRNRDFAVKVFGPAAALSAQAKDRLYAELVRFPELSHRNIVRVDDAGEVDGQIYIASELLAGAGLAAHVQAKAPTIYQKLVLIAQVCEGLAFAHSKGMAHGNIKPGNIFVADAGDATVLDFGSGRWQSLLLAEKVGPPGLSPNYFAPEQVLGEGFDARSDVFSVALVLYEILAGRYPFGVEAGVIPRELVHSEPELLRKLDPQIPEEVEQLVVRALKKYPQDRLQSAHELAASLYAVSQQLRRERPTPAAESAPAVAPETRVETGKKPLERPASVPKPAPAAAAPFRNPKRGTLRPPRAVTEPLELKPNVPQEARPAGSPPSSTKLSVQIATVVLGVLLAIVMAGVFTSQSRSHDAATQPQQNAPAKAIPQNPAPGASVPARAPEQTAAPAPPAGPERAPSKPERAAGERPAPEQILRGQVRVLWEAGRYVEAMKLVDEVLAGNPASNEAREWKKKIRAAQEAEAAIK